jgi:hypothetical protein
MCVTIKYMLLYIHSMPDPLQYCSICRIVDKGFHTCMHLPHIAMTVPHIRHCSGYALLDVELPPRVLGPSTPHSLEFYQGFKHIQIKYS